MSRSNVCKVKSFAGAEHKVMTVNFDCGHLLKDEARQVDCDILQAGDESGREVLVLSRKNQLYAGVPSEASESICNTMYLVRNKRTGKAKLLSASSCQLVNCTTSLSTSTFKSFGDAKTTLATMFGSKRTKRRTEVAIKMRATTSTNSAILEETIEGINSTGEAIENLGTSEGVVSQLLPPCNRDATNLREAYPLDKFLTQKDMDELKSTAELYLSPPEDISLNTDFLVEPFYQALGSQRTLQQVQLLLYANSLLTFIRLHPKAIENKDGPENICPYSNVVGQNILKKFTDTSSGRKRVRTSAQMDRAICHTMVAILLACDYKMNVEWLFNCLKGYRRKNLNPLIRLVGLVPTRGPASSYTHHLKLPLPSASLAPKPYKKRL